MTQPTQVLLQVGCPGLQPEALADLALGLREQILDAGVDDVVPAPATGAAPPGAKSAAAAAAVGAMLISLGPTFFEGFVDVVSSWLKRQPNDVEVEIDGRKFKGQVTAAERAELVAAVLRRGEPGAKPR